MNKEVWLSKAESDLRDKLMAEQLMGFCQQEANRFPGVDNNKLIKVEVGTCKEGSTKITPTKFTLPMTKKEAVKIIMEGLLIEVIPTNKGLGGQQTNFNTYKVVASHPEWHLKIESGACRSATEDTKLVKTLFELALEELVKY